MRILIDGYNLIRRIPELRTLDRQDLESGREGLIRGLSDYRAGKRHRIMVVFDGTEAVHLGGGSQNIAGVSVRYSPRGRSADSVIKELCREGGADVVVSGDREITDAARVAGVTPVSPEHFWDRVQEEMYRRYKGEEPEDAPFDSAQGRGHRTQHAGGKKLSKDKRRDRGRIEKL